MQTIGKLSQQIFDESVHIIIELLPDISRPEFFSLSETQKIGGILDLNFSSFIQTIPNFESKFERLTDIVVCVFSICFLD